MRMSNSNHFTNAERKKSATYHKAYLLFAAKLIISLTVRRDHCKDLDTHKTVVIQGDMTFAVLFSGLESYTSLCFCVCKNGSQK